MHVREVTSAHGSAKEDGTGVSRPGPPARQGTKITGVPKGRLVGFMADVLASGKSLGMENGSGQVLKVYYSAEV